MVSGLEDPVRRQMHCSADTAQRISVWGGGKRQAVIHIPPGSTGIIHREGDICFFAQDFGKLERKEVLEIRTAFVKRVGVTVVVEVMAEGYVCCEIKGVK